MALTTVTGNFSVDFTATPDVNGGVVTFALSIHGGNGTASGLVDSQTGEPDVLVQNGNTIEGHVGTAGGALAFTISVNPNTGVVTFAEDRAVFQTQTSNSNPSENVASIAAGVVTLTATITDGLGHQASASLDLGKQISITDDGPSIVADAATVGAVILSESDLPTGTTPDSSLTSLVGHFSGDFTDTSGADGLKTTTYTLSINGGDGTSSGLVDTQSGESILLTQSGDTITGHIGSTTGATAFTITVNESTGDVTFMEDSAVQNNNTGAAGVSLSGLITLTQTITDNDGTTATASVDVGSKLAITDDTPLVSLTGTSIATMSVSESLLPANTADGFTASGTQVGTSTTEPSATENFSKAFSDNFGADGQAGNNTLTSGDAAVAYSLSIGTHGAGTGLIDTLSGDAVTLVQNGAEVDGVINAGLSNQTTVFSYTVDSSGNVRVHAGSFGREQRQRRNPANGFGDADANDHRRRRHARLEQHRHQRAVLDHRRYADRVAHGDERCGAIGERVESSGQRGRQQYARHIAWDIRSFRDREFQRGLLG